MFWMWKKQGALNPLVCHFADDTDDASGGGAAAISDEAIEANQAVDDLFGDEDPTEESEQDSAAEEEPPADDADAGKPDAFPEYLLMRAKSLGLDTQKVQSQFSSPKDLEAALELVEASRPTDQPQEPAEEKSDEKPPAEDEPYDCGLSADEFDPTLVKAINRIGQEAIGAVRRLQRENSELKEHLDSLRGAWATRQLDDLFSAAPEEYREFVGEGGVDDLDPDSEHFKNRGRVVTAMTAIAAGLQQTGQKVPSHKALFRQALSQVFGDELKAKQGKVAETKERLERRAKASMGRPGGQTKARTELGQALEANSRLDELL